MSDYQDASQATRVDELRKAVLSLKLEEVQQFIYNLPPRPPAKTVTITVNGRMLQIKQEANQITTKEQVVWTCPDGRVEIRFSPAANPFASDMYEVARGGRAYSGTPVVRKAQTYKYTILVTTQNGLFLTKEVDLVVTPAPGSNAKRARQVNK